MPLVRAAIVVGVSAALPTAATQQKTPEAWPSFRGRDASGIADGQRLPDQWNAVKGTNVACLEASSRPRMPYFSLASTTIDRPSGVSSGSDES
jgi:hypothetical protein